MSSNRSRSRDHAPWLTYLVQVRDAKEAGDVAQNPHIDISAMHAQHMIQNTFGARAHDILRVRFVKYY